MDEDVPLYQFFRHQLPWLFIIVAVVGICTINSPEKQADIYPEDQKTSIEKTTPLPPPTKNFTKARPEYIPKSVFGKKGEHLLHPIIFQTANRYQVEPALVNAIIMAESEYNPKAVSKKGARGLMQLMPATAEALGVSDSFNPEQNIDGGVRYFKKLVTRFNGDLELALAAYNAGSRKVRRYKGVPPFKATKIYIKKVFKYYQIYKDHVAAEMDRA